MLTGRSNRTPGQGPYPHCHMCDKTCSDMTSVSLDMSRPEGILERIRELYLFTESIEYAEPVTSGYLTRNFILRTGGQKRFLKE